MMRVHFLKEKCTFFCYEKEVCAKFAHTTQHGSIADKTQTREINYYNLDMIISVGIVLIVNKVLLSENGQQKY